MSMDPTQLQQQFAELQNLPANAFQTPEQGIPPELMAQMQQPGQFMQPTPEPPPPNPVEVVSQLLLQVASRQDLEVKIQAEAINTLASAINTLVQAQAPQEQGVDPQQQFELEKYKLMIEQERLEKESQHKMMLAEQEMQSKLELAQVKAQMDAQVAQQKASIESRKAESDLAVKEATAANQIEISRRDSDVRATVAQTQAKEKKSQQSQKPKDK